MPITPFLFRNAQIFPHGVLLWRWFRSESLQICHAVDKIGSPWTSNNHYYNNLQGNILLYSIFIYQQVSLVVELDDVHDYNDSLAEAVVENAKRYISMVSDIVYELLPLYKEKEVGSFLKNV